MSKSLLDKLFYGLALIAFFAVSYLNYLIFVTLPNEKVMGPVQRIFYFHVGSAIACYLALVIVLVGSLVYLANRSIKADAWAQAGAEVGFLFASIVLLSGMIWGYAAWNTPFRWEPRLVSFLVLWFMLLALGLVRKLSTVEQRANQCSVLGIITALSVPLVVYSIRLLPQTDQLHPVVVERGGLAPEFRLAMVFGIFALALMLGTFVWAAYRVGMLERLSMEKNGSST
jgi:heme exporter protein C